MPMNAGLVKHIKGLNIDDVREAIQQAVADRLVMTPNQKGDGFYFAIPGFQKLEALGLTGDLNVSWFRLAEPAARAAATVERVEADMAKFTPEQRRKLAEKLLADL